MEIADLELSAVAATKLECLGKSWDTSVNEVFDIMLAENQRYPSKKWRDRSSSIDKTRCSEMDAKVILGKLSFALLAVSTRETPLSHVTKCFEALTF